MSESHQQQQVIEWVRWHKNKYPILDALLFATPNGGKRNIITAARLKKEGAKAGVLDLCLPISRQGYSTLWIEMKFGKNKLTPSQELFKAALESEGACVQVCYTAENAIKILQWYVNNG